MVSRCSVAMVTRVCGDALFTFILGGAFSAPELQLPLLPLHQVSPNNVTMATGSNGRASTAAPALVRLDILIMHPLFLYIEQTSKTGPPQSVDAEPICLTSVFSFHPNRSSNPTHPSLCLSLYLSLSLPLCPCLSVSLVPFSDNTPVLKALCSLSGALLGSQHEQQCTVKALEEI